MKKARLISFLNNIASFSETDIRLFESDNCVFSSLFYDKNNLIFNYFKNTLLSNQNLEPKIIDSKFGITFAVLPFDNGTVVIGPVLTIPYENSLAKKLVYTSAFDGISTQDATEMLSQMPYFPIIKFTTLTDSINVVINKTCSSIRRTNAATINEPPQISDDEHQERLNNISYDFEKKISSLITYGLPEKITSIISATSFAGNIGILSDNSLRQTQNMLEVLLTISSRAAISGGLPPSIAYSYSDKYFVEIEKMTTPNDFSVGYELLFAFANAVKNYRMPKSSNYNIKLTQKYIDSNITSPLSLSSIASALSINKNYLSVLFKREIGITLTEYIAKRKINYAKYLLQNTPLSLSEIAYKLSYSSQSAFSNTFKNVTGLTPNVYRKKHDNQSK